MTRRQWLDILRRHPLSPGERILRGTLLAIPMDADGRVTATDTLIANATGLPLRTVSRHLSKAAEHGWLRREIERGGRGQRCRFTASAPGSECAITGEVSTPHMADIDQSECATSGEISTPESTHYRPELVRHLVANINKESANVSEHVAVDQHREPQPNHDDSRDERNHELSEQRIDEQQPCGHSRAAVNSNGRCSSCIAKTYPARKQQGELIA